MLRPRGKMRTDSTHILTAVRVLNRLECAGETMRQALNVLATVAPDWLSGWVPAEWYDRTAFVIDWEKKQAICPQGHPSRKWSVLQQNRTLLYNFHFHRAACDPCPVRAQCTQSPTSPRSLTIQPQAAYEALHAARQRQRKESLRQQYALDTVITPYPVAAILISASVRLFSHGWQAANPIQVEDARIN